MPARSSPVRRAPRSRASSTAVRKASRRTSERAYSPIDSPAASVGIQRRVRRAGGSGGFDRELRALVHPGNRRTAPPAAGTPETYSALARLALGTDPLHVPDQARDAPARDDQHPRQVDLATAHAVERRGGEGVMVVVPGLAERERREPQQVARVVLGGEAPPAEEVTQRVDAVGDVMQREDAHRAAPQHRLQRPRRACRRSSTPRPNGIARPTSDQSMKVLSTNATTGSASRSGAKRSRAPRCVWSNSQPTWAWARPRSAPRQPPPWSTCGLCGSPRRSV